MDTTLQTQDSIIYQLADALMAQTASASERERIDRAIDLVGGVERLPNGQWSVASSTGQRGYLVNHDMRRSCTCPDYQQRGRTCKHGYAVVLFQQAERADAERHDPTPILIHVDVEDEAIPYTLTLLGEPCALPAQCPRCKSEPRSPRHRDGLGPRCISAELYGGDAA